MIVLNCNFNSDIFLVIRFYIRRKHILLSTRQLLSTYFVLELLNIHKGCDWGAEELKHQLGMKKMGTKRLNNRLLAKTEA